METALRPLAWLLAAALLLAACAGTDAGGDDASPTVGDLGRKPSVEVLDGDPPDELVIETLIEGSGEGASAGDTLVVHYVGVAWSSGQEFDSSWDRGQAFTLTLPGRVIEGWNRGLEGIKVGERRRLVIPPELAYGSDGVPGAIGPNETLIFVVDRLPSGG